jgi:hypothetical protein
MLRLVAVGLMLSVQGGVTAANMMPTRMIHNGITFALTDPETFDMLLRQPRARQIESLTVNVFDPLCMRVSRGTAGVDGTTPLRIQRTECKNVFQELHSAMHPGAHHQQAQLNVYASPADRVVLVSADWAQWQVSDIVTTQSSMIVRFSAIYTGGMHNNSSQPYNGRNDLGFSHGSIVPAMIVPWIIVVVLAQLLLSVIGIVVLFASRWYKAYRLVEEMTEATPRPWYDLRIFSALGRLSDLDESITAIRQQHAARRLPLAQNPSGETSQMERRESDRVGLLQESTDTAEGRPYPAGGSIPHSDYADASGHVLVAVMPSGDASLALPLT